MGMVKDFHELVIWQRSHSLALEVYRITRTFPKFEQFGLTSQIQRAVISIPSNIAEGSGRDTSKELYHFLVIARGSLAEVQAQLLLARDLEYLALHDYENLYQDSVEIHKMLNAYLATVKKKLY